MKSSVLMENANQTYDHFITDGYCLVECVLDGNMLQHLRVVSERLINSQGEATGADRPSTGSMISVQLDPLFAELVSYPRALKLLEALGFLRPKYLSGYLISKPPHSPPLFWHQDWWGWNDACSYTSIPQQLS